MSVYNKSSTINMLQALRVVAVVLVMIAHAIDATLNIGIPRLAMVRHFENFGAVGVDIFFVISGVIMTVIASGSKLSAGQFLLKRYLRILPVYWLLTILFCSFPFVLCRYGFEWEGMIKTITILPIFDRNQFVIPLIFSGWTLSYEFLFYLYCAIGILINRKRPFVPTVVLLMIMMLLGLCFTHVKDVHFTFISNPILAEFLLGCLAGKVYMLKMSSKRRMIIGFTALTFSAAIFYYVLWLGFGAISEATGTIEATQSWQRVYYWGISSFLLVLGGIMLESNFGKYVPNLAIKIGNSSYVAYLIHSIWFCFFRTAWTNYHLVMPDLFIILSIASCLCIAYLIHLTVEKPIHQFLLKKVKL